MHKYGRYLLPHTGRYARSYIRSYIYEENSRFFVKTM